MRIGVELSLPLAVPRTLKKLLLRPSLLFNVKRLL